MCFTKEFLQCCGFPRKDKHPEHDVNFCCVPQGNPIPHKFVFCVTLTKHKTLKKIWLHHSGRMALMSSQTATAYGEGELQYERVLSCVHCVSVLYTMCVFIMPGVAVYFCSSVLPPRPLRNEYTSKAAARRASLPPLLVQPQIVCASSYLVWLGAAKICFTHRARAQDKTLEVKTSRRSRRWWKRLHMVAYVSNHCWGILRFSCFVLPLENILILPQKTTT